MKIYINKLPKNCLNCPCHSRDFEEGDRCNLGAFNYNTCDYDKIDEDNYKHKDCPLIDIKTHDRELVKEVCDKIKKEIESLTSVVIKETNYNVITGHGLYLIFEQIKKEYE